jgi:hypothetical protein
VTDTDHYLVVAKLRERLAVSKKADVNLILNYSISGTGV